MEPAPQPSSTSDRDRTLKIAGLALLGCVAVCGVLGTCLLGLSLVLPLLAGGGVGP